MKNVDSLLKAELEKLGVPVERLKYGGKAACFIVYQLVVGRDTFFSDDEEGAQEFTYQVHVYSKTDYIDILQRLKTALKAAGFYAITIDAETYEGMTHGNNRFARSLPRTHHDRHVRRGGIRNARAYGESYFGGAFR